MAEQLTEKQRDGVLKLFLEPRIAEGVIYEPRGYFDVLTIVADQPDNIVGGDGASFYNGEAFPVRITHLSFAVQTLDADPRLIQRMRMRIRYHDAYYMSRFPSLIPLWANVITATPDIVAPGVSTWRFPFPLMLGQRDTIQVRVQDVEDTGTFERDISAAYWGVGTRSKRPYQLTMLAPRSIDDNGVHTLDATGFRNDGSEPVAVQGTAVQVNALSGANDQTGDSRPFAVQMRQIGNGTNTDWFQGPQTPPWNGRGIPAALLGVTGGRAIVHELPYPGFLLMPGDGFIVDAQGDVEDDDVDLAVGAFGTIAVK